MADPFGEEWFSPHSQQVLASLGRSVLGIDGDIVEVGSWTGRSTCALARAVNPRLVHSVDTWEGSPGEVSRTLAAGRDVYAEFSSNVAHFTAGNVDPHRMGWRDYFETHRDPLALVFIDAAHTYEEVRDNIEAVLPLVVRGGVICGDDVHDPGVQQGVLETLEGARVQVVASLWVYRVEV